MIIAGYVVVVCAIADFVLFQVLDKPYVAHWVWSLMLPYFIFSMIRGKMKAKSQLVRTYIDTVTSAVWAAFGYSVFLFLAVIFSLVYVTGSWQVTILITPSLLIMMGLAQFVTAKACRFRPFLYGAVIFWIGALFCVPMLAAFGNGNFQMLPLVVCVIAGFIIPGHILNCKATDNV
jgi:hypothetical protein